jgi:hypothetical protein
MCCAGEYWVVWVDTEHYDPEKYLKALLRDETSHVAQRAFRSYLGVVPSPPVGFKNFSEQVNRYMEKPPFSFPTPLIYIGVYKTVSVGSAGVPCLRNCLCVCHLCIFYIYTCMSMSKGLYLLCLSVYCISIYICLHPFNIYLLIYIYVNFLYLSNPSIHLFVCLSVCCGSSNCVAAPTNP